MFGLAPENLFVLRDNNTDNGLFVWIRISETAISLYGISSMTAV